MSDITLLALLSQASSPYIAEASSFWEANKFATTLVNGDGTVSLDYLGKQRLEEMGYSQSVKSKLKDEWSVKLGNYSRKIYISNNPTWKRNIIMGDDIEASAKNLYTVLDQCDAMKWFNRAYVISSAGRTARGAEKTR